MKTALFDSNVIPDTSHAIDFVTDLLESSTEYSIIAKDLTGKILLWNEGARRIYGYGPEELVGIQSADILHTPEDVAAGRPAEIMAAALDQGKWEGTIDRIRKNGERFPARVVVTPRKGENGVAVGFLLISKDISGEVHLTEELQEAHNYARSLVDANIDALMTTDPLGFITDVNTQMCDITGKSREQLIGTPFKVYFTDPVRAEDGIRRVLAEDRVTNYDLVMRSADGTETVVSYNAATFRDASGALQGVFAAARDVTEHKRLEDELRQAQDYTRSLIEASADALLTVDPTMTITDVNEQTVKITGHSREELIGSEFKDYFTDPERAIAGVQLTLADGVVTNYVLVFRTRAQQEIPVSFNASVFKDAQGEVLGIFASARDISDQSRMEDELREAQNYTRGLIESSVDAMITVDAGMTITDVNEQMVRLTQVPKPELIGSRFDGYFTEPSRAAEGVRTTLRDGFVTNYELTLRTPDGQDVLVSFNASIFLDPEGRTKGVFAVARDVTAQRLLEEQLREQQNYSRGLIEASVDALVTVDPAGLVTDVNDQMIRLTGHSRQQLVGSAFAKYFTDPEQALAGVRKTFADGVVTNYELAVRSRDDVETVVSFNAAVFRDTADRVAGIFAAARDVTDQKRLEEELREQQIYARGLIESNIDALMTTDTLGIITDVNRQMCEITGHTREGLIGTRFRDYCTDPLRAEDGIRTVLRAGQVTNYELTIRSAEGRETTVSYNATTFLDAQGRLKGVFAAARDILDQKRLEQELRDQQSYNRGLIESSVDAMLTVDRDLTITDVNEQMVRLSGYPREDLVGTAFQTYFTEPDRASAGVQRTLDEGFVTNYELTLRSRHRREILVSFNASVFRDTEANVRGIFAVARDVTEQRRLEEQLRESQHYNRGLIESSVDALVTVDTDLTVSDVNEQMVKLTGYPREELVGSLFTDYFTEPARAADGVRLTLEKGSVTNYELVLRSRGGKRTVVSFNAGTFQNTEGQVAGILAAARDITDQKRLEQELRDQQSYNRSLIESSVDALMTVDPQGVITDVNEQTVGLLGYNRRQLVGSSFSKYFTEPERAEAGVRSTFDAGIVTNYELVVRSRSGRKRPVSFNASVFLDTDGHVVGILAAARDNTMQKAIEQQLTEQQIYTRGLIESNIDALMTTDTLGFITDVNKQMCALTGKSSEELIGTPFKDYFTDPTRAEDGVRQVLLQGRVTNYELTIRGAEDRETVVSYNATTFTDADDRLRGVFAAARDITEQKRLEEQIRQQYRELLETSTFLNNILESSTEYSIIAVDLDGKVLAWNEGARLNYGYDPEETVGVAHTSILHTPEDVASGRVDLFFQTAFEQGKSEGVYERVRKNGERFTASVAMSLRRDSEGTAIGYVLISKDITEQKRLEGQLQRNNVELEEQYRRVQEANRLKSEFLANMSHELRTPLNAIIGFSELMHDEKIGSVSADQREYLGDILTSSRHLLRLINDVLDLSKVESGKMEFWPEQVDLGRLIDEVRDIVRTIAAQKHIRIITNVEPGLGPVVIDPAKLKQVLYNYLSNAMKFSPGDREVHVRALAHDDQQFRIEVEDFGIGIRSEDISRLFVEFQQLDSSVSKQYAGTGLGLALTRRIVQAQGGQVGVESEHGRGSTFWAILPRVSRPGSIADDPLEWTSTSAGARRILIIEDDDGDALAIGNALKAGGYEYEVARTGADALARWGKGHFDAVTLDILLPDMDGWQLWKQLSAAHGGGVPAVVVTVMAGSSADPAAALVSGILAKPVRPSELLAALAHALEQGAGAKHRILLVDDDPSAGKLLGKALSRSDYELEVVYSSRDGLDASRTAVPDAVVLDLLMPESDGFDFLADFRKIPGARGVPVLVWTGKDLTATERRSLAKRVKAAVPKSGGTAQLVTELDSCFAAAADITGARTP